MYVKWESQRDYVDAFHRRILLGDLIGDFCFAETFSLQNYTYGI